MQKKGALIGPDPPLKGKATSLGLGFGHHFKELPFTGPKMLCFCFSQRNPKQLKQKHLGFGSPMTAVHAVPRLLRTLRCSLSWPSGVHRKLKKVQIVPHI